MTIMVSGQDEHLTCLQPTVKKGRKQLNFDLRRWPVRSGSVYSAADVITFGLCLGRMQHVIYTLSVCTTCLLLATDELGHQKVLQTAQVHDGDKRFSGSTIPKAHDGGAAAIAFTMRQQNDFLLASVLNHKSRDKNAREDSGRTMDAYVPQPQREGGNVRPATGKDLAQWAKHMQDVCRPPVTGTDKHYSHSMKFNVDAKSRARCATNHRCDEMLVPMLARCTVPWTTHTLGSPISVVEDSPVSQAMAIFTLCSRSMDIV